VLQNVVGLARFEQSPEMWLTIVLAGHSKTIAKLPEPLLGLADLRIDVEPWRQADAEDSAQFPLLAGEQIAAGVAADAYQELILVQ
jgi:hypothetical protein